MALSKATESTVHHNLTAKSLAKQLVNEIDKVAACRQVSSEVIFAVDPVLLHMIVAPTETAWHRLLPLLANDSSDTSTFTVGMQGASLARRLARHILLGGVENAGRSVNRLLHGHLQQFVAITDAYQGAANRRPDSLELKDNLQSVQDDWFDRFVGLPPAVNADEVNRRIDEAIAHVPDQFFKALGISDADVRWQTCAEVMRSGMVAPLTRELLEPGLENKAARESDLPTVAPKDTEGFIAAFGPDGRSARDGSVNRHLISDAMALAHLQRVNLELARQEPPRRCMLVTSSDGPIYKLLASIPAQDFGAAPGLGEQGHLHTAADYCLVDPYAFLDECHLNLTGSSASHLMRDSRGRLSKALRVFGGDQTQEADAKARALDNEADVSDFSEVWGAFLKASVLEQLQSERGILGKRRREVLYALRNAGISTSEDKNKSFIRALTERGGKMMLEAADVAIASNHVEDFVRGAPFLRLDCHPKAEQLQWLEPKAFRAQLLNVDVREELSKEAQSLYTVHLMQARALVWEDRWSAATILTEFTLGLKDSLKTAGIQLGLVDGREAYLLASYCIRMHKAKAEGLKRAREFVQSFRMLAQSNLGLAIKDRLLHELRADAEELAISTMEVLEQSAPQSKKRTTKAPDGTPLIDKDTLCAACERVENDGLALIVSKQAETSDQENDATVLSAYLTTQQCWVNRTQVALLCRDQTTEAQALAAMLWRRYVEIDKGIHQRCPKYKVGESRFTRTIALLAKACSGATLSSDESAWIQAMLNTGQIRGSAPYAEWRFDAISALFRRYSVIPPLKVIAK